MSEAPVTRTHAPVTLASRHDGAAHQELAVVVAVLAVLAAALGLLFPGVYGSDEASVQMLRGFDAVTLMVGTTLFWAVRSDRHGSALAQVVVASLLAYLGYTYAYHLLGVGLTDLTLLHAALLTATLVALGLTLRDLSVAGLAARVPALWMRGAALVLALLALSLGSLWVYACIAWSLDGTMPAGSSLVESDTVVHLGIVLDLTLLVPLYGASAVLLWRRLDWGFVLGVVALVAGTLHQLSYVVALVFQYVAQVPGSVIMDPVEPVIVLLYGVATALLLLPRGRKTPPDADR